MESLPGTDIGKVRNCFSVHCALLKVSLFAFITFKWNRVANKTAYGHGNDIKTNGIQQKAGK